LNTYYDAVVHTTPPFYRHDTGVEQKLAHCYQSALGMAFSRSAAEPAAVRAAVPLLGSGARGFPFDLAIHIAAEQSIEWLLRKRQDDNSHQQQLQTVAFGLLEQEHAEQLSEALQRDWNNSVAQKRDGERRR
jgi:O-acetyl-ADP-ribose deacetylase (regulator of RNase III)